MKIACCYCHEDLSTYTSEEPHEFYVVNPPGGYGRGGIFLCIKCLHEEQVRPFYERLLDLGALEERDILREDFSGESL